jgi:hypothetical protein
MIFEKKIVHFFFVQLYFASKVLWFYPLEQNLLLLQ